MPAIDAAATVATSNVGDSGQTLRLAVEPSYPFVPKSTASLRAGQYWAVPLSDGRFACGRVIATLPGERRLFLAALMDWVSDAPPGFESLAGAGDLVDNGEASIKAITETGGEILGIRPLDADGIEPLIRVSHRGGGTVYLLRGATRVRAATAEEAATLPVLATWGYLSIAVKAEARFVDSR